MKKRQPKPVPYPPAMSEYSEFNMYCLRKSVRETTDKFWPTFTCLDRRHEAFGLSVGNLQTFLNAHPHLRKRFIRRYLFNLMTMSREEPSDVPF